MRISRPLVISGAALLVAGLGVGAYAEKPQVHVMKVALPDGSVRQIRYTGDTPPRIVLVAGTESPFAGLDRMMAAMDAQRDAMMRQVAAMTAPPVAVPAGDMQFAALARQPAGAHYSYTSTTIVNGKACTTSVQTTSLGDGKQPRLLRRVSGDGCSGAVRKPAGPSLTAAPATPTPPATPHLVSAPAAPRAPAAPKVPADTI